MNTTMTTTVMMIIVLKSNLLVHVCLNLKSTCAGDMMHLIEADIYIWVSFCRTGKMSVKRHFFLKVEGWCC